MEQPMCSNCLDQKKEEDKSEESGDDDNFNPTIASPERDPSAPAINFEYKTSNEVLATSLVEKFKAGTSALQIKGTLTIEKCLESKTLFLIYR
jgi:hypothetical protein